MRPYVDADLSRLWETYAGWIAEMGTCGYDHVGEVPYRIYANLRGRGPVGDLVQLWEDGDDIVGLAINMRFGSAFDVFTAPSLHGTQAELAMLTTAAETTARHLAGDAPVLTDVFSCDTTRIRLVTQLGFERFRVWDDVNERDLHEPIATPDVPAGFVVREARRGDAARLAAAHNDTFDEDWTAEQYRSAVLSKPGYEMVAESPDGRIAAFAGYWIDERNKLGHVEPVGTPPEFQRRGLARAVLLEAMNQMHKRGMATVSVDHDAENLPARELYRSLGFVKQDETYGFRRDR